jgi:hypothetical protein
VLLAVVALGVSLRACLSSGDGSTTTPTASAAPSPPARVTVLSATYVGKSASSVRAALLGLGLTPALVNDGQGTAAGTVSSVTPTGPLLRGAAVTVHVVPVARVVPPDKGKHPKGKKK